MNPTQEVIINIYKEIRKLCKNHNIDYYTSAGTTIGAVRHHGFIPWDDDMDLMIPIESIADFIKYAKKDFPPYLEIYSGFDIKHTNIIFIKVIDNRTAFIEKQDINRTDAKDGWKGVFVDVFPLAGVPYNSVLRFLYLKYIHFLSALNYKIRYLNTGKENKYNFKDKIILAFIKNKRFNIYYNKIYEIISSHKMKESRKLCAYWGGSHYYLCYDISLFDSVIEYKFEDTLVPVPVGYDKLLRDEFGDYMQLPPTDKRKIHNGYIDLNNSYKDYQKGILTFSKLNIKS